MTTTRGSRWRSAVAGTARWLARPGGAAAAAGIASALLLLLAPRGGDQAAHLYLTQTWRESGWQLWDNFWYSGRYAQVNYSLLFYPLAALLGTTVVVAGSAAGAAGAFASLLRRRWPAIAAGPGIAFAALSPLAVVAGQWPFLLGLALALGSLAALAAGRRVAAVAAALVTALAHPLALAFLGVVLVALAASTPGWWRRGRDIALAGAMLAVGAAQALLFRGFASRGAEYPIFLTREALAVLGFCLAGILLTRGLPDQRVLRALFAGYAGFVGIAFAISSPIGGNAARLLFLMAAPLLLLPLAARGFRPRAVVVAFVAGTILWQSLPAVAGWQTASSGRARDESFWYPVIAFIEEHSDPGQRVQVVATADNWEAYYLARRGVPLARGWFRQDDFPANAALYKPLTPRRYRAWMRRTAVRYVFLPDDPLDYSARAEAELLRSGRSGLREVARLGGWTVFALPNPTPIVTPAEDAEVLDLTAESITLRVARPGVYRLRLRYTPYWRIDGAAACAAPREPWGTDLRVAEPGVVRLTFAVRLGTFVGAVLGDDGGCGDPVHGPQAPWAPSPDEGAPLPAAAP